jgi:hypothetical protein
VHTRHVSAAGGGRRMRRTWKVLLLQWCVWRQLLWQPTWQIQTDTIFAVLGGLRLAVLVWWTAGHRCASRSAVCSARSG